MSESGLNAAITRHHSDDIDLHRLFGLLIDNKMVIILITLAGLFLGVLYALTATPIYRADAMLQLEKKQGGLPGFDELSKLFESESPVIGEIEILRSRMVLGEAVDSLGMVLQVRRTELPVIGRFTRPAAATVPGPLYGALVDAVTDVRISEFVVPTHLEGQAFELRSTPQGAQLLLEGAVLAEGSVAERIVSADNSIRLLLGAFELPQGQSVELIRHPRLSQIDTLRRGLSVSEQGRNSGILSLAFTGPSPARNRAILNAIADAYLMQNIRRLSAEAEKSLEFLEGQLPEIRAALEAAEERLNKFRLESGSVDLTVETQQVLSRLVALEAKENELLFQEKELGSLYTKEHPAYRTLIQQQQTVRDEKARLAEQVRDLPETQQEVLRMTRDVHVNQEIYVQMLNRSQELRVVRAGTVGNVRIIDRAESAQFPIKPQRLMIVMLSLVLGGMMGVGVVLLRAAFRRGIETPAQIEEIGLPVYAAVPLSERQRQSSMLAKRKGSSESATSVLALEDPSDLAVESLRSLRTSLHFAMMDAPDRVLMVTGPSPNIGKSFVASNLAVVLSQVNERVLIVDCDMRKGQLHRAFRLNAGPGLSQLLSGSVSHDDVIQYTSISNLHFIGRGLIPPNPAELLMHPRFAEELALLRTQYDLIILDTPPILAVTDAAIIGRYASTSLLVARFEKTPVHEIQVAQRHFLQNGVEIKGAILNCIEKRASNLYGYYPYRYAEEAEG